MATEELSHSRLFDDPPPPSSEEVVRRISQHSSIGNEATDNVCDPQAVTNGTPLLVARDGSAGSQNDRSRDISVTYASTTNSELANLASPEHPSSKARTSPYSVPLDTASNGRRSLEGNATPQMPAPLVTKRTTPILSRTGPGSRPESNGHSSPSRRSHHDFQEALKVDELAAKVETLTKVLGEREAQNVALTTKIERLEEENARLKHQMDVSGGGRLDRPEDSEKFQRLMEEKEALEIELRAVRRCAEEDEEEQRASKPPSGSLEFDRNDPNLLRRKIEDLQTQVQDLQEANESTSLMLSQYRSDGPSAKVALDPTPDPLLLGQHATRRELEALHGSHLNDSSAGALRREIESLRSDLDALRHRNEVVVAENEALRRQGPHLNTHRRDILATAARTGITDTRHIDLQRHQRELEGDLEAMQRLREQIRDEQKHSPTLRSSGQMKSMSYGNLSSFENEFRSPYSMSRSLYAPAGEEFSASSRRYGGGSADVRQRSSSVERTPVRREPLEERSAREDHTGRNERILHDDRGDSRSTGSTSSILSDAERELEDMKRSTNYESRELSSLRRSTKSPPLPSPPHGLRSVSPPPIPTQHNRTALSKSGYRPDADRSAMFSLVGRHPFAPRNAAEVQLNDIVKFTRQGGRICKGVVHFVGHLPGRNDVYVGVELEHEDGKHDGTYEGRRYFQCKTNKGVFVAFNKLIMCYGARPF